MKKLVLAAMLGLAIIGTSAPMSASASDWGCSLNPGGVYRQNEADNYAPETTPVDYSAGGGWASLDDGPDAIYARAANSDRDWRSSATYIENGDWKTLGNQTMQAGHDYYLWCKNAKATTSWVWASGSYDW